jgi:hypothetical protein
MNIIDAWKQAKYGQRIERKSGNLNSNATGGITKTGIYPEDIKDNLITHLLAIRSDWVFADDWEVVKEKQKKVHVLDLTYPVTIYTAESSVNFAPCPYAIPKNSKVTIEWEE